MWTSSREAYTRSGSASGCLRRCQSTSRPQSRAPTPRRAPAVPPPPPRWSGGWRRPEPSRSCTGMKRSR
ncbi:hypothetical protein JYU34_020814 [Plutella xylostella]|uniref:Uncharacterized protein n=1 Tax=Plutella xylostella TaxID=51655 RepID=A0ABQ7PVT3_PLUXY|nr:hypothetical protein JYU34_020814 [Plutella xylostella]